MINNYILFGGSGFIGHHLANYINRSLSLSPVIFDIENSQTENINFEQLDVRCPINTDYKPSSKDVIFNLAAVHRTPGHKSTEYFETNLLGAQNICNYAREHNISTIVFTSSIATYGTYEEHKDEKTLPMPDIPYGISKLTAEYIHRLWQLEDPEHRKLIIVRPGVVFGQNENGNFTRLINSIANRRFFYPGRKDTIKSCIYVKDLVDSMINMVEKEPIGTQTYNMTYDPPPTIEEICRVISVSANISKPIIKLPPFILTLVAKFIYLISKNENFHPDRIRKLMISNNVGGKKLNNRYKLKFGLKGGIIDWMKSTKFRTESKEIF